MRFKNFVTIRDSYTKQGISIQLYHLKADQILYDDTYKQLGRLDLSRDLDVECPNIFIQSSKVILCKLTR